MELLLDGNRGIYIPQTFAKTIDLTKVIPYEGMDYDIQTCLDGPDNDEYWEAWDNVIDELKFTDGSTLYQDGDLWAIADGETIPDETETGGFWGTDENGEPFHTWDYEESIGE